jgi:hypothetical protein
MSADYDSLRQNTWQDLDHLEMAIDGLHADANLFAGRVELLNDMDRLRDASDRLAALLQKLSRVRAA